MAALESKPSGPVEPTQGDKPSDGDEVSSTTPSFVANLLRNDGMTLLSQPGGGMTWVLHGPMECMRYEPSCGQ